MKQKILAIIAIIFISAIPLRSFAQADIDPAFNPSKLIDDKVFSDTQTFGGPAGIQKFLETKSSILANTSPEFIAKLREPNITILKQALDDPQPSLPRQRTAAEIIWDVSQSSGINPQVILVTLNKEQSLVTGHQNDSPEQMQRSLDFAMGFGCPDSGGCDSSFVGFYFQLFGNLDASGNRYLGAARSLVKSFNAPGGRGPAVNGTPAKVGDTITLDNTLGGYNGVLPQQSISLSNAATAALYRYTPHVFNGNYNFWRFFNAWFRYPNGTLLNGNGIVYIIQNGTKQQVPSFVATARGLNLASAITVSSTELETYPTDKIYGPADNTVVSVEGKLYVFIANVKHPASAFVITQRGLDPANALTVTAVDAAIFQDGSQLTPSDGTVLKGQDTAAIYLVDNGTLKLFSPYTFAQRNAAKQLKVIPQIEIDSYPKGGYVAPLNGTLVKASNSGTVYLLDGGVLRPLTAELFKNLGYQYKNIAVLQEAEIAGLPRGDFATPKDNTYFITSPGKVFYLYKEGSKHVISAFVAGQKHLTPDYTFATDMADKWPTGISIAPRDNTVLKSSSSATVYIVQKGQLRPMTYQAYLNRKLTPKKVTVVSQAEIDSYAKGDVLTK